MMVLNLFLKKNIKKNKNKTNLYKKKLQPIINSKTKSKKEKRKWIQARLKKKTASPKNTVKLSLS